MKICQTTEAEERDRDAKAWYGDAYRLAKGREYNETIRYYDKVLKINS